MSLQAVLMCGGLGRRLRPWSFAIPKPMFPIGERHILELLLERLRLNGITEIYVSVGYLAELIEVTFKDGAHLGVNLEYVRETEPLGTAGSAKLLRGPLRWAFPTVNREPGSNPEFHKLATCFSQRRTGITDAR